MKDTAMAVGLLLLRLTFGCFMLVHGWQKLAMFGDLADTFPDPIRVGSQLSLVLAIGAEFGCSLLVIVGLGTRLAVLPLAFTMIVALFIIHAADPWQRRELAAIYLAVYAVLVCTGPGRFSLDHLIWKKRHGSTFGETQTN